MNNENFKKALDIGRPPNIKKLFPNSRALIVSGKVIDRAITAKGKAMAIAVNGRSSFIIRGALLAAQKANSAIIVEIAKFEGGASSFCQISYWNLAMYVDNICNELGITVPVAVHADHYVVSCDKDIEQAETEIPSLFDAGITSIAIDGSHLPDDKNLLLNIGLNKYIPSWAGLETEVGEIKGSTGLTSLEEAEFLVAGLNAYNIFPDWIAINNGSLHGIVSDAAGINVKLTKEIYEGLKKYGVSGAQHGTSGNSLKKLSEIAEKTGITKANVATALQMVSWGLEVNEFGNPLTDSDGNFVKIKAEGVDDKLWEEIIEFADSKGWKGTSYKHINRFFENNFCGQAVKVRERMIKWVEDFIYNLIVNVFNSQDTAPLAIEVILDAGSYDPGPKTEQIESQSDWTHEKIIKKASELIIDEGEDGNFHD